MKLLLTIFVLSFFAATAFAQRVSSNCDAPDSVKRRYQDEAAWLAYQYEQKTNSPYLDSVYIKKDLHDRFLRSILSVYNAPNLTAADTVTKYKFVNDYYRIPHLLKSYRYYSMGVIDFIIDSTIQWQNLFSKGISPTGNLPLDSFIMQYKITFDTIYRQFYQSNLFQCVGYTHESYNMIVLDSLLHIVTKNSLSSEPRYVCCDGDRIDGDFLQDSTVRLIFSFGWCDCYAGCACRRYWEFTVFPDCSVRFNFAYGNPMPLDAVPSEITTDTHISLSPNPALGILLIECEQQCRIEIVDLQGKILETAFSKVDKTEIDISSLPQGIYLVRVTDKKGNNTTAKFIKE